MSAVPDSSLRELESKLASAITVTLFRNVCEKAAPDVFHAVMPLVSASLAAARADEREKTGEQIAFAIRDESKRIGRSLSYAEGCADSAAVALRYAHDARSAEPKEQQT